MQRRSLAQQLGMVTEDGYIRPGSNSTLGFRPALGQQTKAGHESTSVALMRAGSQQHSGYHVVKASSGLTNGMTPFARKLSSGGIYNPLPEPEPRVSYSEAEAELFRQLLQSFFGRRRLR